MNNGRCIVSVVVLGVRGGVLKSVVNNKPRTIDNMMSESNNY